MLSEKKGLPIDTHRDIWERKTKNYIRKIRKFKNKFVSCIQFMKNLVKRL